MHNHSNPKLYLPLVQDRDTYTPVPDIARTQYSGIKPAIGAGTELNPLSEFILQTLMTDHHIPAALARMGFRRLAHVGTGTETLIFDTTCDQVLSLRLDTDNTLPRVQALDQLQSVRLPLSPRRLEISVMPKLRMPVSPEDQQLFSAHCDAKGYGSGDAVREVGDIGYLPDGKVLGADKHAINLRGAVPSYDPVLDAAYVVPSDRTSCFPQLAGKGVISAQEHFYPMLADGRIRGILSDDDRTILEAGHLEQLRHEKPECFTGVTEDNLPEFIQLVFEDGLYPKQAQEMLHERHPLFHEQEALMVPLTAVQQDSIGHLGGVHMWAKASGGPGRGGSSSSTCIA